MLVRQDDGRGACANRSSATALELQCLHFGGLGATGWREGGPERQCERTLAQCLAASLADLAGQLDGASPRRRSLRRALRGHLAACLGCDLLREQASTRDGYPCRQRDQRLCDLARRCCRRDPVVRIDGRFDRIHARSVPKQAPPYRPLDEVAQDMVEWNWHGLNATVVGFRFDSAADGLEIVGHHMHVISDDRAHSGHVLGCDLAWGRVRVESIEELHCELPPGVDLVPGHGPVDEGALKAIEEE